MFAGRRRERSTRFPSADHGQIGKSRAKKAGMHQHQKQSSLFADDGLAVSTFIGRAHCLSALTCNILAITGLTVSGLSPSPHSLNKDAPMSYRRGDKLLCRNERENGRDVPSNVGQARRASESFASHSLALLVRSLYEPTFWERNAEQQRPAARTHARKRES